MGRKERIVAVVVLAAVALFLRVGFVAWTEVKSPLRSDAGEYARYAHNLVEHGVFSKDVAAPPRPDSFRSPGYPVYLAVGRWLAGEEGWYDAARYGQAVLGAAMVPLAYLLASWFLPLWAALAVAALVALSPHLVAASGYVLTEALQAFVLLAACCATAAGIRRGRIGLAALGGLLFGGAALVNEAFALLPVVLVVSVARGSGAGRGSRRVLLVFLLAFAAPTGAWAARNATAVDDPSRSNRGRALATLSHGTYPGFVHRDPRYRYSAYLEDPEQPEFGRSWARFWEVFSRRVAAEPLRYASWYLLEKPYWLWTWNILQGQGDVFVYPVARSLYDRNPVANATRVVLRVLHGPLVALAAVAAAVWLWLWLRRRPLEPATALVCVPLLYVTVIYSVFAPWPRYGVPLRPELYAAGVWGGWLVWRGLRRLGAGSRARLRRSRCASRTPSGHTC